MNKRTVIELIVLISIATLIRVGLGIVQPDLNIFPDSFGYYGIGQNIILSPTLKALINPFRPFLYPLFLNAAVAATGHFGAPMQSAEYFIGERLIGIIQAAAGVIGCIFFYFMLRKIFQARYVALGISIFQAISINAITWERSVLSESLSIPFTLIIGFFMITALTSPTWLILLSITFLSIIGLLLRPATIIYPFIIFPLIAYYHKTTPVVLRCLFACGLFLLFVIGYAKTNEMNWKYFGIQNGSDINLLARIMQFRLPLTPAKNIQPLYDQVQEYSASTDQPDVWAFIDTYHIDTYSTPDSMMRIRSFDMAILKNYPVAFVAHAIADIPSSFLYSDPHYEFTPTDALRSVFYILFEVFQVTRYIYLASIPFIFLAWIRFFFRKTTLREASITCLGTLAYGTVVLYVFTGTGNDYARFYCTVQPFLLVFCVYWLHRLTHP